MTSTAGLWKSQSHTGPVVLLCCHHTSAEPVPSQHATFQTTLIPKLNFSSLKGCWWEGKNRKTWYLCSPAPIGGGWLRSWERRGSRRHLGIEAYGKSASFSSKFRAASGEQSLAGTHAAAPGVGARRSLPVGTHRRVPLPFPVVRGCGSDGGSSTPLPASPTKLRTQQSLARFRQASKNRAHLKCSHFADRNRNYPVLLFCSVPYHGWAAAHGHELITASPCAATTCRCLKGEPGMDGRVLLPK